MTAQGKGKSPKEILKRIDYFGSLSLMFSVRVYVPLYSTTFNLNLVQRLVQFWCFWACVTTKVFRWVSLQPHIYPVLTPIQWSDPAVIVSITLACIFAILFLFVEFYVAVEPVLAPSLLKQKIPILIGISNFLVANVNFAIMYFFPMWFQTVLLTSASIAGMKNISTPIFFKPTKINLF